MKSRFRKFMMRSGCLSRVMAFFVALLSVIFFAADSSASQTLHALRLGYGQLVKPSYSYPDATKPLYYYYYIGTAPSKFEAFPVLQNLYTSNNVQFFPYGGKDAFGSSPVTGGPAYPYEYYYLGSTSVGNVPDDWTQDDVNEINNSFNNLTIAQKKALSGSVVAGNTSDSKFFLFTSKPVGSASGDGGVITYDSDGVAIVSYPDNTGFASGYKAQPDGSYTPVYYQLVQNSWEEVSYIPTEEFSTLTYDTDLQHYTLNVPDYREKLDLIANKIDGITLTYDPVINVEAPSVTVNPEITVNPTVTVTPDVTVNVPGSDLTDIESYLIGISNILESSFGSDSYENPTPTNEVGLSASEQLLIDRYRSWETGIPLIGSTLDFGLTTLFGRLPSVGQEFVWIDMDIQPSRASRSSNGSLDGYHIRVSLEQYREIILAFRGWIIIAEAIYFGILVWKLIREALAV